MSVNWRDLGDTTPAAFRAALVAADSPILAEVAAVYEVSRPHSKLCLAQLRHESAYGTEGVAATGTHNPLGLRPRGGDGFLTFERWTDAIREWKARITDPTYAYGGTLTLADYIHVYAPAGDGNDEAAYVAAIRSVVAELPAAESTPATRRGQVPKPPVAFRPVTETDAGVEDWAPRQGVIVGTCHHTMQGTLLGTDRYFRSGVAALTDYGIGGSTDADLDGVIYQWIADDSERVPIASGTWHAGRAFGDGPRFVDAFGVRAINRRLRSIERSDGGDPDAEVSHRQFESLCFLTAYLHAEEAGQTPETFDWNMHHREFGGDHWRCPGTWIIERVEAIQDRVKAIMWAYQTGAPLAPPLLITYPSDWTGAEIAPPGQVVVPSAPPSPPPAPGYAKRFPPPGFDGHDRIVHEHRWRAIRRVVRTIAEAPRLQTASGDAKLVGPPIPPGTQFTVDYVVDGGPFVPAATDPANGLYWVTRLGTRVPMLPTTPHVSFVDTGQP